MVATAVGSDSKQALPEAPHAVHVQGNPTLSATPTASPESQPWVATNQVRDPERYHILCEHGRGGLGRVSRAHDRSLGRDVAIKELISPGRIGELRFLREALITARLEHPGIVPIHEAGRWPDGTPFYAMKLVAGRPLRDLIAERKTVDQRIGLLHHVIAVADAIAYAHGRNIIHRDLKPANVIVGDFGETIVIDWGLAKDLSSSEEPASGNDPCRTAQDNDLTAAGAVLGTPTYMAPEQERGEHVDQRADVFAIGAMLWELCSLHKVPPTSLRLRHRLLKRAGIDKDLAVIIDKALDPDATRRYRDAGGLAADLKAFKSGARISARSYSLFGMLAHWTRRHRTLALSVGAAIILAVAGSIAYIKRIAAERDRADDALRETQSARDELLLKQAELLLQIDPTAAHDLLGTYAGNERVRLQLLDSKARGLGVAQMRAAPHTANILLARPLPDGSILTLGADTKIAKTSTQGEVRELAHDVLSIFSYAESRRILAYACERVAICFLDPVNERQLSAPLEMHTFSPAFLAFSPTATYFAALSSEGQLAIWTFAADNSLILRYKGELKHSKYIVFLKDDVLAAMSTTTVELVRLPSIGSELHSERAFSGATITNLEANPELDLLAISTIDGDLITVNLNSAKVLEHTKPCANAINSTAFLNRSPRLGYACQDGNVGIRDTSNNSTTLLTHIPGGASTIMGHPESNYLVVGGNNGNVIVYNADTQLISTYLGHSTRVLELFPPTANSHTVISADTSGALRVWPLPPTGVQVVLRSPVRLIAATLLSNVDLILVIRASSTLSLISLDGAVQDLEGHDPKHITLTHGPAGRFALYGADEFIELWSVSSTRAATMHRLKTDHVVVTAVRYLDDGTLVSSGRDGRLVEWSSTDIYRELVSIPVPIRTIITIPKRKAFLLFDANGMVWYTDPEHLTTFKGSPYSATGFARPSDGRFVVVGSSQGTIRLYDTLSFKVYELATLKSGIWSLAISRTEDQIAAIADHSVHIMNLPTGSALVAQAQIAWNNVRLRPRSMSFSKDGNWLAISCEDGVVWFYHIQRNRWASVVLSKAYIFWGEFSNDSTLFLTTDSSGQVSTINTHHILENLNP
jgi:WD40 repeat protein